MVTKIRPGQPPSQKMADQLDEKIVQIYAIAEIVTIKNGLAVKSLGPKRVPFLVITCTGASPKCLSSV